jgi:hypothetical protein
MSYETGALGTTSIIRRVPGDTVAVWVQWLDPRAQVSFFNLTTGAYASPAGAGLSGADHKLKSIPSH